MFVDREEELSLLDRTYLACQKNVTCGILVYGWRKVGKTTLIKKFIERYRSVAIDINCAWINIPQIFLNKILQKIRIVFGEKIYRELLTLTVDIASEVDRLLVSFEILDGVSRYIKKPIIFLDEFHLFIEKAVSYIAKKENKRSKEIKTRLYWFLKDIVERKNSFWIFASSLGWEKLVEIMLIRGKTEEAPFVGVLEKLFVRPLPIEASIQLAKRIDSSLRDDEARTIAEISGGIPKHIITIALKHRGGSLIKTIETLMELGEFDEVFESMLRGLAEISKRDYTLFIMVLKAIAEENKTTEDIARYVGLEREQVYYVLEELKKLDLLKKTKSGKYVIYDLQYPLLGTWLLRRIEPVTSNQEKLLQMLGITAESYVRELLRQIRKPIELWDDNAGSFFAGTAKRFIFDCEEVLDIDQTKKFLSKIKNADVVCRTPNKYLVIEVKAKEKPITPSDIMDLKGTIDALRRRGVEADGILIQVGYGKILPTAIAEAIKNNIVIVTRKGIQLLAKKLDFPSI